MIISHKYGLKVFEDVKSHVLNVYYSQFRYLDNGYHFNLARLEIERNQCIAWEYRMYGKYACPCESWDGENEYRD